MNRPEKVPKRIRVPGYVATFVRFDDFDGTAVWDITHKRKLVGRMYEGPAYGWGRPRYNLTKLVWSGDIPEGASDPKSPNYGMCFDSGPFDSYQECMKRFAKAADRLIEWRRENK